MNEHPDPAVWIRLDAAADELKVPRQALADQLRLAGRDVERVDVDGRWATFVRRADIGLRGERELAEWVEELRRRAADGTPEPTRETADPIQGASGGPATIWAQVCALEAVNHSLHRQLESVRHEALERETKAAAERVELERLRLELERAHAEAQQLRRIHEVELETLHSERRARRGERERADKLEHELRVMHDFERAYVNYCDRLERRLERTPRRHRRAG